MTRTSFAFRRIALVPAVAVAVAFCCVSASAQQQDVSERPFSFGAAFGAAARPGGGLASVGLGTLELGTPWRNVNVRFDGVVASGPDKLSALTGNLAYSRRIGVFVPYLLGGFGGYAQSGVGASFGANAGVGIKASVSRIKPFAELREHVWSADRTRRATTLTVGLMF